MKKAYNNWLKKDIRLRLFILAAIVQIPLSIIFPYEVWLPHQVSAYGFPFPFLTFHINYLRLFPNINAFLLRPDTFLLNVFITYVFFALLCNVFIRDFVYHVSLKIENSRYKIW